MSKGDHGIPNSSNTVGEYAGDVLGEQEEGLNSTNVKDPSSASYKSRLLRRVFACPGQESSLLKFIIFALNENRNGFEEEKEMVVSTDARIICKGCCADLCEADESLKKS